VLIVALQPLASRLTLRFDRGHVLGAASLVIGSGYGAYAFCTTPLQYAAATASWSVGEIFVGALVGLGHLVATRWQRARIPAPSITFSN
jgi:hypothetical protein